MLRWRRLHRFVLNLRGWRGKSRGDHRWRCCWCWGSRSWSDHHRQLCWRRPYRLVHNLSGWLRWRNRSRHVHRRRRSRRRHRRSRGGHDWRRSLRWRRTNWRVHHRRGPLSRLRTCPLCQRQPPEPQHRQAPDSLHQVRWQPGPRAAPHRRIIPRTGWGRMPRTRSSVMPVTTQESGLSAVVLDRQRAPNQAQLRRLSWTSSSWMPPPATVNAAARPLRF